MDVNKEKLELQKSKVVSELDTLISNTTLNDKEELKRSINYLKWIEKKSQIINTEKTFVVPKDFNIKRGNVVWVEFGFNIGREFGGKHPALVLRRTGESIFVLPLSSQKPDEIKDFHVKIDRVYGFKNITRWANVLKIVNVDIQRIDFTCSIGNVKGLILDNVNNAINRNKIN